MITKEQALRKNEFHMDGECIKTVGPRGGVKIKQRIYVRNGKTRTWKTRPEDFRVPVKRGLYEYGYVEPNSRFHLEEDCPLNQNE